MARLHNFLTGKLSGTLGDVAFRQVNGNTIVVQKTKSFVPGTDAESVWRRQRFGIAVKLSQAIYSIPELKTLWEKSTPPKKSVYNFILRSNLKLIPNVGSSTEGALPLDSVLLTPELGFPVEASSVVISNDSIAIVLNPLGESSGIDTRSESSAKLFILLCLSDRVNISFDRFKFITSVSVPKEISLDVPLNFILNFTAHDLPLVAGDRSKKAFFVLVILDSGGNIVHHSNTMHGV